MYGPGMEGECMDQGWRVNVWTRDGGIRGVSGLWLRLVWTLLSSVYNTQQREFINPLLFHILNHV